MVFESFLKYMDYYLIILKVIITLTNKAKLINIKAILNISIKVNIIILNTIIRFEILIIYSFKMAL